MSADPALVAALLAELDAAPEGMSAPRLCKRLGVRMSVLMRTLAWIGSERIGDAAGPGLVETTQQSGRERLCITPAGRRWLAG